MIEDKISKYLGESKMGKLPGKVKRTAWAGTPFTMTWELINPDSDDDRSNYKYIENLAWKELKAMQAKKIVDFYENDFNVSMVSSMNGTQSYEAEVKLRNYDNAKLMKELRRLKFKTTK